MQDKEETVMKYALLKLRVYILDYRPFVVYTDHALLRIAVNNLKYSIKRQGGCSFSRIIDSTRIQTERLNVVADTLSRRPDFEPAAYSNKVATTRLERLSLVFRRQNCLTT